MSKLIYTETPWRLLYDSPSESWYICETETTIPALDEEGEEIPEAKGNAILQSVAGELYESLRDLFHGPCRTFDLEFMPQMRKAGALLTKIEDWKGERDG